METNEDTKHDLRRISDKVDGDRRFVLNDGDDTFVRTGHQIINGCRLDTSIEVWLAELETMAEHLAAWSDQRKDRITSCYVWPRGATIAVFFVPTQPSFNFDLADELAILTTDLHRFNVGPVEIHQVPERELSRFLPTSGIDRPLFRRDGISPHSVAA